METPIQNLLLDEKDSLLSNKSFPFETESMVLKGNADYIKLLKHLNTLESLRSQMIFDLDKISELQDEFIESPLEFVRKVENGEDLGVPLRLPIPDMPEIDWTKYKATSFIEDIRPTTRGKVQVKSEKLEPETNDDKVRGRVKTVDKPKSYNQLWTVDEQIKLEQLLEKYPPEENEARRFAKIADELGSRTLAQVTSRCQKYFLKLQKAGLPVPGRAPKLRYSDTFKATKSKFNPRNFYPSTFFPKCHPPVKLRDEGDLPGTSTIDLSRVKVEYSDPQDGNFSDTARGSDEFRKLILLRRVKRDMENLAGQKDAIHLGYRCNNCNEEPLRGTRWHCLQCGDDESVDFCSSCLISQMESETPHPLEHDFAACHNRTIENTWDNDYSYQSGQYNYLDPNFQPI